MYTYYNMNGFPYPDSSVLYSVMPFDYQNDLRMYYLLPDDRVDTCKIAVQEKSDCGPVIAFGGYLLRVYPVIVAGQRGWKLVGME